MEITKILCPVDFSKYSEAALDYASSLAAAASAVLLITHVDDSSVNYVPGFAGYGYAPDPIEERRKSEKFMLSQIVPSIPDVAFEHRFLTGNTEREILALAEREDVDLIVMGSHGRTGLSRVLMGSIAEAIVRQAKCPVLTIKQPMVEKEQPFSTATHERESE